MIVPAGADHAAVDLPVVTSRAAQPGPHVVVLGGVHGDEYEGRAATALLRNDLNGVLRRGSVTMLPMANPLACAAGTRSTPIDNLNLARTFPGRPDGSVTERIAHVVSDIIRRADLLIDLHSAGQHYAMPLLCGAYAGDDDLGRRCEQAALAFGAPIFWAHPEVAPGRSLSVALDAGIPCIYAECGGGGRVRPSDLEAYRRGVCAVLAHLDMLPPVGSAPPPRVRLRSDGNVDLALAVGGDGILLEAVHVLDSVQRGQLMATLIDECGATVEQLRAPADGIVVMARRTARVQSGDGAYLLAHQEEPTR